MFELNINETVYSFRFGLGFVREIDKTKKEKGENGEYQNVGFAYAVAALIDEDPVGLVDILCIANKTEKPRLNRDVLDRYIEDENTDLEGLCADILDFFKTSNSTKKKTLAMIEFIEKKLAEKENETEKQYLFKGNIEKLL